MPLRGDGTPQRRRGNYYGRVGNGTTTSRSVPVHVQGLTGVGKLASGWYHNLVSGSGQAPIDYGYDPLYRLTSVSGASSASYSYDPAGNRSQKGSTSYSYDRADRISAAGTTSYTVNANGNLTARGTDAFTYDQANRLKSASVSGTSSTYVYDGDGKRTSKTVGGGTTNYVYDVNASLPALLDDGVRKYVWGVGLAFAVDQAGNPIVYHTDGLGSVRALTDASGAVVQTYQYDEYGNVLTSVGSITQPFLYTGEVSDGETGFSYLRARVYDAQTGRFVQRDIFDGVPRNPLSLHKYAYVGGNPVGRADPTGLTWPENWDLFWDWVLERGDKPVRFYGPEAPATFELAQTFGAAEMRSSFYAGGMKSGAGSVSTLSGAMQFALAPWNGTGAQVGGFDYRYTNNGDGTVTYTVRNILGRKSFFYHLPFFNDVERTDDHTWGMGNMYQIFEWTEPITVTKVKGP